MTLSQDDPTARPGNKDCAAPPGGLDPIAGGQHLSCGKHLSQDGLDLQEREVAAEGSAMLTAGRRWSSIA
jgi:hypothetical protein